MRVTRVAQYLSSIIENDEVCVGCGQRYDEYSYTTVECTIHKLTGEAGKNYTRIIVYAKMQYVNSKHFLRKRYEDSYLGTNARKVEKIWK